MNKPTKKQEIIRLFEEGKKPRDIATLLETYESTVYDVLSSYKKDQRIKELELQIKNK